MSSLVVDSEPGAAGDKEIRPHSVVLYGTPKGYLLISTASASRRSKPLGEHRCIGGREQPAAVRNTPPPLVHRAPIYSLFASFSSSRHPEYSFTMADSERSVTPSSPSSPSDTRSVSRGREAFVCVFTASRGLLLTP